MKSFTVATAALVASASAASTTWLKKSGVTIYNKCDHDVYLWSIQKDEFCGQMEPTVMKAGSGSYYETFRRNGTIGVSIKMTKDKDSCKGPGGDNSLQFEYYMCEEDDPAFNSNYFDTSFVDCWGTDCPSYKEGYYLKAGNQDGEFMKAEANPDVCPVMSCTGGDDCKLISYWNPDDTQTKSCDLNANIEMYLCAPNGPDGSDSDSGSSAAPVASSAPQTSAAYVAPSSAAPSSAAPSSVVQEVPSQYEVVAAAAVTSAPSQEQQAAVNIKTEVVYVTAYEYVNAKRHAHGHRHQRFHA